MSVYAIQYTVPHHGGSDGAYRTYYDYTHRYPHDDIMLAAKWYAEHHNMAGGKGGWIYRTKDGHTSTPVVQGWHSFYEIFRRQIRDALTSAITAFDTFDQLVNAPPGYLPTLMFSQARGDYMYRVLASEYNKWQAWRNDPRRALTPEPTRSRQHAAN